MLTDLQSRLESLMLVIAGPVPLKKLSDLLGLPLEELKQELDKLNNSYENENRGVRFTRTDREVQLVTSPDHAALIEKALKAETREDLTGAALETLAVVVYKGPIRKTDIDFIRGVNSAYTLRSLLMRGLVERSQESESKGFAYSVTTDFLKHLGVSRISDLPEYQSIVTKLEEIKQGWQIQQPQN